MIRLKTFDDLLAKEMPREEKRFATVAPSLVVRERARHMVQFVLPQYTHELPPYMYSGEMEIMVLDFIWALSKRVLDGSNTENGSIIEQFKEEARKLGIAADVLAATSTSKPLFDAVGTEIMNKLATPLGITPSATSDPTRIKDNVSATARSVLHRALGLEESDKWNPDVYAASVPGRLVQVNPDEALQNIRHVIDYGGIGRGAHLNHQRYHIQARKRHIIEWAIQALYDPAYLPAGVKQRASRYEDAYCLGLAYLTYCYHTATPEAYDQILNPGSLDMTQNSKTYKQMIAARRFALFYAGISASAVMSDVYLAVKLLRNALDFISPLVAYESSDHRDINANLTSIDKELSSVMFAPVVRHIDAIMDTLLKISHNDVLLPVYMGQYLKFPDVNIPTTVKLPTGTIHFSKDVWDRRYVSPAVLDDFLFHTKEVAMAARYSVDDLTAQLSYYYTMNLTSISNEMQIPGDLLTKFMPEVSTIEDVKFTSMFSAEFAPMSIPRYDPRRGPEDRALPTLAKYINCPIYIAPFRDEMRNLSGVYIFPLRDKISSAASLGYRFAKLPVPFCYANYAQSTSVSQYKNMSGVTASASAIPVLDMLKYSLTESHPLAMYFEDALTLIAFHPFQRQSVVDAVLAIAQIKDLEKNEYMAGALPTIYGVPTLAFQQKNMEGDVKNRSFEISVRDPQSSDEMPVFKKFLVTLHRWFPAPGPLMRIPHLLVNGLIINVPILRSVYEVSRLHVQISDSGSIERVSGEDFSLVAPEDDAFWTSIGRCPLAKIKSMITWLDSPGYAKVFVNYPHLTFEYKPSLEEWLSFPGLKGDATRDAISATRSFLYRKIARVYRTGGPNLIIHTYADFTAIMPEMSDVLATGDEAIPDVPLMGNDDIHKPPSPPVSGSTNPVTPIVPPRTTIPVTGGDATTPSGSPASIKTADGKEVIGAVNIENQDALRHMITTTDSHVSNASSNPKEGGRSSAPSLKEQYPSDSTSKDTRGRALPNDQTMIGDAELGDTVEDGTSGNAALPDDEQSSDTEDDFVAKRKKGKKNAGDESQNA